MCIPGREHVQQPRSQFSITNSSHQIKVFNIRERGFLKTGKKIACLMINPSKEPPLQFCGICPYWVPGLVNYHGKRMSHAPPRPELVTVIHVDSLFISSNDILPEQKIELVWHEMCNPSLTARIVHFGGALYKSTSGKRILHPNAKPRSSTQKGPHSCNTPWKQLRLQQWSSMVICGAGCFPHFLCAGSNPNHGATCNSKE